MKLLTNVSIDKNNIDINYNSSILLLGSCFSNSIGDKLLNSKFSTIVNPFGVMYNPISISQLINRAIEQYYFKESELIEHRKLWHNPYLHGSFSCGDKNETLNKGNNALKKVGKSIQNTDYIIITFGTSWVYKDIRNNEVVGNCHKRPQKEFMRNRLTVEEIYNAWLPIILYFQKNNPELKIIFTVSPIRYFIDGAHENQLSKSILLLAIEMIKSTFPSSISYFPSFEILLDELRDYRFYNSDMIHPSSVAIDYIYERFCDSFMNINTHDTMNEIEKIQKLLNHKPLNPDSEEHKYFLKSRDLAIDNIKLQFPNIKF